MGLLKTAELINRVKTAEPAEAQGPAIAAGPYRARVIDAGSSRKNPNDIFVKFEIFEINDTELTGASIKKQGKVFKIDGPYGENEASDLASFIEAVRMTEKIADLKATDLIGNTLIVGMDTIASTTGPGFFNGLARGGYWDASDNKVEFEPRDDEANQGGQRGGRGRGRNGF